MGESDNEDDYKLGPRPEGCEHLLQTNVEEGLAQKEPLPLNKLKSFHKEADPRAPLFEEWVDSPSSFSVLTHSLREMNVKVYDEVKQNLPSMWDAGDDTDDDSDDEVPVFTRPSKPSQASASTEKKKSLVELCKDD